MRARPEPLDLSTVRALSLRQPWADAIVDGEKRIETRSWQTRYRGWLLIHASGIKMTAAERALSDEIGHGPATHGAIIGAAWLMGIVAIEAIRDSTSDAERRLGDYSTGRFAWLLTSARRWPAIEAKGRLQLWQPKVEIDPEDGRITAL